MLNFDGGVEAVKLILKLQMSSRSIQGDTSVVVLIVLCFGVEFLCCLILMIVRFHIFSSARVTEWPPIGE